MIKYFKNLSGNSDMDDSFEFVRTNRISFDHKYKIYLITKVSLITFYLNYYLEKTSVFAMTIVMVF